MEVRELPVELRSSEWLHGLSAFTTVRLYKGKPLFWKEHVYRLCRTCTFLGLPDPLKAAYQVLPQLNRHLFHQYLLRLTVVQEGFFWHLQSLSSLDKERREGTIVWLSNIQVHPQLAQHKTGNYLPYLLAARQAQENGAFEALLIDGQNDVVDGSKSSFLIECNGKLLIPSGGLPSITRRALLSAWQQPWTQRPILYAEIKTASRMWLAGSGIGIIPVKKLCWTGGEVRFEHKNLR